MKKSAGAAAFLICAASQSVASPQLSCEQVFDLFRSGLNITASSDIIQEGNDCVLQEVQFVRPEVRAELRGFADEIRWSGVLPDPSQLTLTDPADWTMPAFDLQIRGMRWGTVFPDGSVLSYLMQTAILGAEGTDLTLTVAHSGDADMEVALAVDFQGDNAFRFETLITPLPDQTPPGISVKTAQIEIASHGLFETMLAMPLGGLLLDRDSPPEEQVLGLKTQAAEWIGSDSEALLSDNSAGDLISLIGDMPHPRGVLRAEFTATAPSGLPVSELTEIFATANPSEIPAKLAGLAQLNVQYDRADG